MHEVYCEMTTNGGGYTFISNETLSRLTQDDLKLIFTNKQDVLLRLLKPDGTQPYTVIKQYTDTGGVSVQLNSHHGYTRPRNYEISNYLYLGLLPNANASKGNIQGFISNGNSVTFTNCDDNKKNYFAFFAKPNDKPPNYSGHYETQGVAVAWRGTSTQPSSNERMSSKYFLFTTVCFAGCGCYTESSAWPQSTHPALGTAIGIR